MASLHRNAPSHKYTLPVHLPGPRYSDFEGRIRGRLSPASALPRLTPPVPPVASHPSNGGCPRARIESRFPSLPVTPGVPVTITGAGFFDSIHNVIGQVPNGIELHPIAEIDWR